MVAIIAVVRTVFNKRWWIERAVKRWQMRRETIDGVEWVNHTTGNLASFRVSDLLAQPLRRLREFYDTGDLKPPGVVGESIEQNAA